MALRHFLSNAGRYVVALRHSPAAVPATAQPLPVFVINLQRNPERRRFALGHLASLGMQASVFPAVDGKTLALADLEARGLYRESLAREKFSRPLSLAEIGCTLSHLGVYRRIVEERLDAALVLEDDAMLTEGAAGRLRPLLAELPEDWDLVQLTFQCRDTAPFSPSLVRFLMRPTMPVAATAYIISRRGAQKMIDAAYPVHYPADSLIGRSPRWGMKVFGATPQLATVNNVFPSNIAPPRSFGGRVSRLVKQVAVRMLR